MHTKIWWSYVHIRYLVHVQKWTYLALGWPYGWALNFNNRKMNSAWKIAYEVRRLITGLTDNRETIFMDNRCRFLTTTHETETEPTKERIITSGDLPDRNGALCDVTA